MGANYVVTIGKIKEIKDNILTIEIYKWSNENTKETIQVDVLITDNMLKNITEYLNIGDITGVKGSLDIFNDKLVVKCEKLSFLSSKNNEESGE